MAEVQSGLAIVTGGASGIGKALAANLLGQGTAVAICDKDEHRLHQAIDGLKEKDPNANITAHLCDVADRGSVERFAKEVQEMHSADHITHLFNNAGIGGGYSFVDDSVEDWERTFNTCWQGTYNCTRVFFPSLMESKKGYLVNVSSVNGLWASGGPGNPRHAYSTAKYAIRGFTEALVEDLRLSAPHIQVHLVIPGHIGTNIVRNTARSHGKNDPLEFNREEVLQAKKKLLERGVEVADTSDDQIRQMVHQNMEDHREKAPVTAAEAAAVILSALADNRWRVLIGQDAQAIDELVRDDPESIYEADFIQRLIAKL